ncbi:ATP-binding protein [Streptomyces xanthochromogenes]|uniref:ATP-binding protein n=1 Tax=Streptomyces xanthochromogenes TaxID=67384 RepID=UPI00341E7C07
MSPSIARVADPSWMGEESDLRSADEGTGIQGQHRRACEAVERASVRAAHELWFARTPPPGEGLDIENLKWPMRLRHQSRGLLKHWRLEGLGDRVGTVLAELVNNALVHGGGSAIGFRLTLTEAGVLVEVADSTAALVSPVVYEDPDEHGRGLLLVEAFADDWGTRPRGDGVGKWTWASFTAPARTEGPC